MSLINYIEPVSIGGIFVGLGSLISICILTYCIFRVFKPMYNFCETIYNKEVKYSIVEEKMLDDIAKEKGIDIEVELMKRNVLAKPRKNFRRKIEEQVFDRMFPKEEGGK